MDRYISSLHKNVLAYNLCFHLEKCKTQEEIIETVGRILDNFEEKRPEFLQCNTEGHCATENTCRGCVKYNGEPTIDYFKCMRNTKNSVVDLINRQKAEIERLMSEMDQRREMMHRMDCNYATQLKKIDELQKQVDELDKFNTELQKENSKLVGATNLDGYLLKAVEQQAIKDTAKEICFEIVKDMPETIKEQWIKWFHERYGVEV